ncbi:hypothetical protein HZ326_16115 [Fusarium oxysporum f. sp. albedinis]|nr:hypothetical protein HZ326_16115 [Fusarium oxysporum f. sp. albedinis]
MSFNQYPSLWQETSSSAFTGNRALTYKRVPYIWLLSHFHDSGFLCASQRVVASYSTNATGAFAEVLTHRTTLRCCPLLAWVAL